MRWTWLEPVAVCQFLTSSFTEKSAALSPGTRASLPGAVIVTVGRLPVGSGLAAPSVSVTGGGGALGGVAVAGGGCDTVDTVVAPSVAGTGGGGGGGGRLSG